MDFFDKLVIPPSQNHILLLKYILMISFLLFIPYIGMVLGSTFLSNYFNKRAKETGNELFSRFARDVIKRLTFNKNAEFALGILPMLSITFGYAQLLFEAKTITMSIMALSVILVAAGLVTIYRFRGTFEVESVLLSFKRLTSFDKNDSKSEDAEDVREYEHNLLASGSRLGRIGFWTLITGVYLFAGCMGLASNPEEWPNVNNILQIMFSWNTIFNFMYILAASGIITGIAILFFFFEWQGGLAHVKEDPVYSKFVKTIASWLALVSAICLPLFMFMKFLYLPSSAQAPGLFTYMLVTFILVLILSNLIYSMVRNSDYRNVTVMFILTFIVFTFGILNDQTAFGSAISEHMKYVVEKSEELEKEVKSKTITSGGVDADAIFNSKCIACHRFDVKLVGPPYQQTVPKYNGDVNALAEFIFNPIKKNPDFPPMPNQGLKKKEAQAMAKWLIEKVTGKK